MNVRLIANPDGSASMMVSDGAAHELWTVDLDRDGPALDGARHVEPYRVPPPVPYPTDLDPTPPVRRPGSGALHLRPGDTLGDLMQRQIDNHNRRVGRPIVRPEAIDEQIQRAIGEGQQHVERFERRRDDDRDDQDDDDATGGRA